MAMRETEADMDDVPPPPYSETDIYSISGRHSNPSLNSPLAQSHHGDDAASRVSSHASSRSDVIYTPPLTPQTGSTAAPHHYNSNPNLANHAHAAAAPSAALAHSVFAAAYFESRPAPAFSPWDQQLVHLLAVTPSSTPDDVPYPSAWAARDVTQQDWATFTNCLIPHHAVARNEAVINRKLQAEEEAVAAAAASRGGSGDNSPGGPRSISSSHASAQLDRIRPDPDIDPGAAVAASGPRREDVEAVVAQWNEGFFRPRGLVVLLTPRVEDLHLPGAWDRSLNGAIDNPAVTSGRGSTGATPMPPPVLHAGTGPGMQPDPGPSEARGGWSFGGITVTTEGISIGDRIVADSNGIRLGNLIADENGIRFGSNTIPRAQPHFVGPNANWAPPPPHAPSAPLPMPMFGPRPGPGPGPFPPRPHPHNHAHARHGSGSGARGRPYGRYPSDQRSVSASSSASSVSSASSASSVGSLPDYEDLCSAQLPVYKQRVASWLAHPDEPVTKADVAQLCDEIRSAQSVSGASEEPMQDDPSVTDAPEGVADAPEAADEKALKAELKSLTQEWRKLKRQQRAARKEKRRERRARRREEKKERKEQRRERREQRRDGRWDQKEMRRGAGGEGDGAARGNHQHHHHHHHHGPKPKPKPAPPPPHPHAIHVPPPPVVHAQPIPAVPILLPSGPNNFQWGAGPERGPAPPGGFSAGRGAWAAAFGRGWGRGRGPGNDHAFPPNAGPLHPHGAWSTGGSGKRSPDTAMPPVPPPS
ncbi:hypothetical protein LY76DRAFT_589704 [Colletotrichum caudatum]|nr:hypothetical protein LY76DRAFT_589704 [Colletotrichum caudatum]